MCWREAWGWNLQARVPGFQMAKCSIDLLCSGRDIWSWIMRWFLRAEVEQSQGQMWGSSLKWGEGRTSLTVQWSRIHLAMQGTRV